MGKLLTDERANLLCAGLFLIALAVLHLVNFTSFGNEVVLAGGGAFVLRQLLTARYLSGAIIATVLISLEITPLSRVMISILFGVLGLYLIAALLYKKKRPKTEIIIE